MGIKKLSKFLYACDDIVCISRPVDTYGNETTDDLRIFPLASVTTALHENQDVSFIEQQLDEVQEQMVQLQDLVNGSQARIKMRNEELLDRAIRQKQMLRREKEQEALPRRWMKLHSGGCLPRRHAGLRSRHSRVLTSWVLSPQDEDRDVTKKALSAISAKHTTLMPGSRLLSTAQLYIMRSNFPRGGDKVAQRMQKRWRNHRMGKNLVLT